MATAAQINANRMNAQHSTGPRTEEGKSRSAANATKHGMTGKFRLLSSESQAEFDELHQSYTNQFDPQSQTELDFVQQLTEAKFRQMRANEMEARILEAEKPDLKEFSLLLRYKAAADRAYNHAEKRLMQLAKERLVTIPKGYAEMKTEQFKAEIVAIDLAERRLTSPLPAQAAPPSSSSVPIRG